MIISTDFIGDNNDELKEIQHEFWLSPSVDLEHDGQRMNACFYIFHRAKEVFLSEVGLQPLTFPELEAANEVQRFDHRVLQDFYGQICTYYRWMVKDLKEPVFANDDWYYGSYQYMSWVNYFMRELNSLLYENLDVVDQVLRAVLFQNTDQGFKAESYLESFMRKRYAAMSN